MSKEIRENLNFSTWGGGEKVRKLEKLDLLVLGSLTLSVLTK